MASAKHHVLIKGVKDGLVFVLDDISPFEDVMTELKHKLEKTHQQLLAGPAIHVSVSTGRRKVTAEEEQQIRNIIDSQGQLHIKSILSLDKDKEQHASEPPLTVRRGIIRSGQTLTHEGDLFFLGDVNPGGSIVCSGDIHVMGSLRGMAHAGVNGKIGAIITASYMRPTQLRIAHVVSRPPDEWETQETYMEFAYIRDGKMEIDKITHLHRVRPDASQ